MLRKCAISLAVIGALSATQANALGLGEVKVSSALNQPLKAEIDLLQLRGLSESQIITGLADADDFFLAGVKPTAILSDISFKLDIKGGEGRIILTSSEPIREPFLNFLIEVNWPSGRLVREYTVLLDPPVFTAGDLAPRNQPVAPVSQPKPMAKAVAPAAPAGSASTVMPAVSAGPGTYHVKNDDTLWQIALRTRPDRSISPQQMMLAIQKANPDAFYNNNINRLKSGVVLDIPTKQQILGLNAQESMQEVKRQNSSWKGAPATAEKPKAEKLDAAKSEMASGDGAKQEDAQLRIVSKPSEKVEPEADAPMATATSEPETAAVEPAAAEAADEGVAAELTAKNEELEEQLVVTLEGLDKVERDNAEMFDRLDQLSQQMESLQRLLELKDQQLAELQGQLAQKQAQPAPAPVAPPAKSESLPMTLIGGIGAAVLALLAGLLMFLRRRREDQEVEEALVVLNEQEAAAEAQESQTEEAVEAVVGNQAVAEDATDTLSEIDDAELDAIESEDNPDDPFNLAAEDDGLGGEFDTISEDELDSALGDDLDMDLKLDEPIEEDPEMAAFSNSLLDDDEYDLSTGMEEDETADADDDTAVAGDIESIDTDLDALLGEDDGDIDFGAETSETPVDEVAEEVVDNTSDELDNLLEDDLDSDLDALLAEDAVDEVALSEDEGTEDLSVLEDDLEIEIPQQPVIEQVELDESDASADDEIPDDATLDALLDQAEAAGGDDGELGAPKLEPEDSPLDDELDIDLDSIADLDMDEIEPVADEDLVDPAETQIEDLAVEGLPDQALELDESAADSADDELEFVLDTELSFESTDGADAESPIEDLSDEGALDDALSLELNDSSDDALELDVDAAGEASVPSAGAGLTLEQELEEAGDAELEAELEQMLESDDNALALEETELDADAAEVNYLDEADEVGTKLDLARAYIDMDDTDGAKDILQEVISEGSEQQIAEAQQLLESLNG